MKKITNEKQLRTIIEMGIIILITALSYWIFKSPNVIFIANLIVMLLILMKAKFSYFSMKTILMNYVLIAIFFQYNTEKSYGILEISQLQLHYLEMSLLVYIYNCISYTWISTTKIIENEKNILNKNYYINKISIYFCCILAIATAIIAFPGMPFNNQYINNRFVGLLQGNAWNHISIVSLIFLLPNFKRDNIVKITYAFTIFWFISHYERVDIIGLLIFCFIYMMTRKKHMKLRNYIIAISIAVVVVFSMVYLGEVRANNTKELSLMDITRKTLVQNTAADIGYVFNTSIEYYQNHDLLFGKSYFTYIVKLIPMLDSEMNVGNILGNTYGTPGGEFILSEPLMNFGILGMILFQILEFSIYNIILSKNTKYRFFLYAFLIATVFRTTWYGWFYIEKAIVYFIPIIYFSTKILDNINFNGKHTLKGGTNETTNKGVNV